MDLVSLQTLGKPVSETVLVMLQHDLRNLRRNAGDSAQILGPPSKYASRKPVALRESVVPVLVQHLAGHVFLADVVKQTRRSNLE